MENNLPPVSPEEARAALSEADAAQRAVRDTPWPTWLYPVNALLLGAYALATLLEPWEFAAWLTLAAAMLALNVAVGKHMGAPWILPTSRGFLTCVVLSAACMVGAVLLGPDHTVVVVALAAGASTFYLVGSVLHHRSTRR